MIRIIASIPIWIGFQLLIFIPLLILGYLLIPIAVLFKAYKQNIDKNIWTGLPKKNYHFTWKVMWLWDNFTDGIADETTEKMGPLWLRILYWSCIRNPVNNLRRVPILSVHIIPFNVRFIGSFGSERSSSIVHKYDKPTPQWFFCWHGLYSNFYIHFRMFGKLWRFWIGWKILPSDIIAVERYRQPTAGFALQFKRIRT